jgi:3-hydroxybutyryl-CoA dehydrogenase
MSDHPPAPRPERVAVAGSGAIACGVAVAAARQGPVLLLARSHHSAGRARTAVGKICARLADAVDTSAVEVTTDFARLAEVSFVVESIVEDHAVKAGVLSELHGWLPANAVLATTTSSLSIADLARASGRPDRFVGLHVFNPVVRMKLIELVFPAAASSETRARTVALCRALDKTAVEVPDIPGFVVNRLLFPYLFGAVRLLEETGMAPEDVDTCMTLGAGHPMGPLALLDLVGLDVAEAIGETIGEPIPARVRELVAENALGRKSGRGFHSYSAGV